MLFNAARGCAKADNATGRGGITTSAGGIYTEPPRWKPGCTNQAGMEFSRKESGMPSFSRFFWLIVLGVLSAGTLGGLLLWPELSRLITR